jgi:hypothetical protein
VFATDLLPNRADIARHDFLHDPPRPEMRSAVMVTNPPNTQLTEFIIRGLTLIDAGWLAGLVVLCRTGADDTDGRAAAFNRAAMEWRCCWRPYWKPRRPGDKQPRWNYHWHLWLRGCAGPPMTCRLTRSQLEQPELDLQSHARG